jgi:dihydrofolate synthase / folylpolyglutamate synthase
MNYKQTLEYLFTRLPMFSRIGAAAYKADLSNTIRLCDALGNPQNKFKSIHIAGTNGKGSTSHMLAAILQTAGYKTGLYTSPHLKDFRERIKINGEIVSEKFVIEFTEKIKSLINEIEPSFFEITVAMAFEYFAQQKIDIAVVETGLGGRLDSTNIIVPELSVITSIGWDHMNLLGDSLEKIAFEKAGIIKYGVPVVIGEMSPETLSILEQSATEKNAPVSIASKKRQAIDWSWENHELVVEITGQLHSDHKKYRLDLPGIYQTKNLLTVLEICSQLQQKGWMIDDKMIHRGLKQTKKLTGLYGRWEVIHTSPTVVLEVAHNIDGMQQLVQQIEVTKHNELHIVLGMVKDKDIERILTILPKMATYYFTKAQIPRALSEEELMKKAGEQQLKGKSYSEVNTALQMALQHANPDDLIIVCGSVFLVGEINATFH